ncbi:hypothetical protein Xvie_03590 [Xenorhabdus vietnamensis]|uniref:Uncharacterized protein n=1 Tax=Xenorhabdus vietnamensis TaxID=351656 RepID=A0A1Y2S7I1_9GAMM|nr:hypothetical protein [Xenorhabdus vietnamensis]OTA14561.1 hypothetical protein Xvie_03590 [Xenorhabdus vietnamensis]
MTEDDVYLIHNSSGADKCPAGKLALYTNINFNETEIGDILVISPNIQLDTEQLEGYGFIVGGHDGVSSVVNNMSQNATLISGLYLDGETLTVSAGKQISSLVNYPLGSGTWNDAVNSVVSANVTTVNLTMTLESGISIQTGEEYSALLQIKNNSSTTVTGATIEASSGNPDIFTVDSFPPAVDIPANGTSSLRIPLTGEGQGSAALNCRLYTPLGIINSGDNTMDTTITVTAQRDLQVTQEYISHWKKEWDKPEYIYSYKLILSSAEDPVSAWELSFLLPEGAEPDPNWLASQSSWLTLNTEKSVNGEIYLDSISGHVIAPNQDVELDIQILYPGESTDYETLQNLRLEQLS